MPANPGRFLPVAKVYTHHRNLPLNITKGFWVNIASNGRLLNPELADRLGDAGVAVFNFALDAWDLKPGLTKALVRYGAISNTSCASNRFKITWSFSTSTSAETILKMFLFC